MSVNSAVKTCEASRSLPPRRWKGWSTPPRGRPKRAKRAAQAAKVSSSICPSHAAQPATIPCSEPLQQPPSASNSQPSPSETFQLAHAMLAPPHRPPHVPMASPDHGYASGLRHARSSLAYTLPVLVCALQASQRRRTSRRICCPGKR